MQVPLVPELEGAAPATAPARCKPHSVDPLCSHVSPTQLRSPNRHAAAAAFPHVQLVLLHQHADDTLWRSYLRVACQFPSNKHDAE